MARTAIKFGLFVVVCLVFTVSLASIIGNTSALGLIGQGEDTYSVEAAFDDVTGLLIDDNVKVAGVPVGKVTGISVEEGEAVVTMSIRATHRFPADSGATIRWRNLIGQRFVYIEPGSASTTLADGDVIADTKAVVDLGELFNRLGPIVAAVDPGQVNEFLETVNAALEGNEADVAAALDDLAFVVQGLADRDVAIGNLIENLEVVSRTVADRDAQIETMLENLALLAETFSANTGILEQAILEMGAFNRDLSTILVGNRDEIDRILVNLATTLGTVDDNLDIVENTVDLLDEVAAGAFNTTRNGTFLNQTILCLATQPPPCPTPIVPGLSTAGLSGDDGAVLFEQRRGADAIRSIFGSVAE